MRNVPLLRVVVAYATPADELIVTLELPEAATLADAVRSSGILARPGVDPAALHYAIFGETALPSTPLLDGDRIELTRPLAADPKRARRDRAREAAPVLRPKPSRHRPKPSR